VLIHQRKHMLQRKINLNGCKTILNNATRIGKSPRRTFYVDKSIPGPGQYTLPDKSIEGPKYHIGLKTNASEALITSKEVPGPGQYTPMSNAFSTIAFS
jgi:hypothetical protein